MTTEDGTEEAVLHPTDIEFLELRIAGRRGWSASVIRTAEEAANVGVEVGIARQREAQACWNLFAKHVPCGIYIAAPHVRAIVLLACKRAASHDEDALGLPFFTLFLVDAANCLEGEGVSLRAPSAAKDLVIIVRLLRVEEVRVGRIHPPSVGAIVEERLQVLPVDVASLGIEGVIDFYARGIVHPGRPDMRESALRPGLYGKQKALLVEFAELLRHGSEAGPDGDHEVGVLLMNIVDELLAAGEVLAREVHRVPHIVASPVLPVLDDAVERHFESAILVNDALRLGCSLVAFFRLPEAEGPHWEHRHIACQVANLRDNSVGTPAIHEVVVDAFACFRVEGHAVEVVLEEGGSVVVPIDAPAFDALQDILEVLQV